MKTAVVIAEFNPFHAGHANILRKARQKTEADYVLVIMSGDFCQRGEPCIVEKYTRTKMALANGADIVLELPSYYSLGSAEFFAGGAVHLMNALNVCDSLVFGSECGDTEKLKTLAQILYDEPPAFKLQLQAHLKEGDDFPTARMKALSFCLPESIRDDAELMKTPNNLLGVEYIKMMLRTNQSYEVVTVPRTAGVSSSEVRELMKSTYPHLRKSLMPESCAMLLRDYSANTGYRYGEFDAIYEGLRHVLALENAAGVSAMADVGTELSRRVYKELYGLQNMEDLLNKLHTKDMTRARVKRALMHIYLAMPQARLKTYMSKKTTVARALGFKKSASPLMNRIKTEGKVPLITKLSQASKLLSGDDLAKELLTEDLRASLIYDQLFLKQEAYPIKTEFEKPLVVI